MSANLQNANGPDEAATSVQAGVQSSKPPRDQKMNERTNSTLPTVIPALSRRGFIGGMAIMATPVAAAAVTPTEATRPSIDDFLARATAEERAWYHANALAQVMGEIHPDHSWRSHIHHGNQFCLIVGDRREERA